MRSVRSFGAPSFTMIFTFFSNVNDSFMATGQSWWYRSGTTGPWEFLNASTKKLSEGSIGFFDGDNRCDVSADGVVYPGGRPAPKWGTIGTIGTFSAVLGN